MLAFILSSCWDHPRVCGEKYGMTLKMPRAQGSPPRMRGKGLTLDLDAEAGGITPAYAGKSPAQQGYKGQGWDHPRVCGEKFKGRKTIWTSPGSPPRMRGKVCEDS